MSAPRRGARSSRNSLGVGVAVGTYGFAFGAAAVAAGLSALQTCLLSLLAFTGGTQFAVVGVVAGGGGIAAALGSGLLLGSRNALYAMRMAPLLGVRGVRRLLAAHGTIDESTAMAIGQGDPALARTAFWWTFGAVFVMWNLATLLGAAGASALGDPGRFGLDAVVPAAFLALLAPRLRHGRVERRVARRRRADRGRADPDHAAGRAGARRVRRAAAGRSARPGVSADEIWWIVAGTVVGCYLLKLVGYLVPARVLEHGRARRLVELVPVALLAALVVVEAIANGGTYDLDGPRLAGVAVGAVAVWRRAPFLVIVVAAAVTAAVLRLAV